MRKREIQLKLEHAQDTIRDLVVENGKLRDEINGLKEKIVSLHKLLRQASLTERIRQW